MLPDLLKKLDQYIEIFTREDEELYVQEISNREAYAYLSSEIPLIDCPDQEIERTYYFRWWTFRKHWKETPYGHILSEFLPVVQWAGPYNSIICAAPHHIREGRWLNDRKQWVKEYIDFWLNGHGDAFSYSSWLISAVYDYLSIHPDTAYVKEKLPQLTAFFEEQEKRHLHSSGLYWSEDCRDGMEYSISGPGLRPTINSYMYGDAFALSKLAALVGESEISEKYDLKALKIRQLMDLLLWDHDFYKTIPCGRDEAIPEGTRPEISDAHNVRELIGYLPWYFYMPERERGIAFSQLKDPDGFAAEAGLTTAEQRHPLFLFKHEHECLWNGYVWPFATSQVLTAAANALRRDDSLPITRQDYCNMLHQYAAFHKRELDDGTRTDWIDENMHPYSGIWAAREQLREDQWKPHRGGYERGKDYNHSTFCDLVLSGLFGIEYREGVLYADPLIPDSWEYFCVTNLPGSHDTVLFDKTGNHYGMGAGLKILYREK